LVEQIAELRKLVQKQEQMIASIASGDVRSTTLHKPNASTDAIASLLNAPSHVAMNIQPSQPSMMVRGGLARVGRTASASTLDGKINSLSLIDYIHYDLYLMGPSTPICLLRSLG
jgi:hypothetical protein